MMRSNVFVGHALPVRYGILLGIVGSLLSPAIASAEPEAPRQRPNIVFIFSDDHAAHAISAYGSKINKTPQIDRLAADGMLFQNCFCTNSICAPSRAVVLTGKHSHLNGMRTNSGAFDGHQQTLPKLLQQAGYQTSLVGKWHLVSDPTGFDHWNILLGQGTYYNPNLKSAQGTIRHTGYTTAIITDLAIQWLDHERDKSKPFLLMLQHKAPHRNWQPGPKYLKLYDGVNIPEPPTLLDDYQGRSQAASRQAMTLEKHLTPNDLKLVPQHDLNADQKAAWDAAYGPENARFRQDNPQGRELLRWKYQRYIKDYLRCIASVDESVGRLLDYLDRTKLATNTVVIYSSDQGFFLGDHGWFDKRWMYEESLRMPLLVRWPGVVKPGSTNQDLVQNLDFAETLLEAAGSAVPADMQGRSLVPLLKGQTPKDWRQSIYYHYYEFPGDHSVARHYGVRTDRHKLVHFYDADQWELFDLQKDPRELTSVYGQADYADIHRELKAELDRLRTQYHDTEQNAKHPAR